MRISLLLVFLSFSAWANLLPETGSALPVDNISYIASENFAEEVEDSKQPVIVVFSDTACLWTSFPTRNCFLFEKKLDYFGLELKARGWKLIGLDVAFRNLSVTQNYPITFKPTVLIFKGGREVSRIEPVYNEEDRAPYQLSWQDHMAKRVLDEVAR